MAGLRQVATPLRGDEDPTVKPQVESLWIKASKGRFAVNLR